MAAAYGERGASGSVLDGVAVVDRAVDLVGRDLQEARPVRRRPARLEQDVDADDPGPQERLGSRMRAVDVRLGGEVDDRVDLGDERPTTSGSAMSPRTKRRRAACSGSARTGARFASLPA